MKAFLIKLAQAKYIIIHLLFLLGNYSVLSAQEYRAYARRYGIEEGLPHRQVNAVLEDRRGLIWAATDAGVVRFDGFRFNTFNKAEQGLSNIAINRLAEDGAGFIWATSHNSNQNITSLDILEPVSSKVTPASVFFHKNPIPVPFEQLHRSSARHGDGTLYFGVYHPAGVVSYHPDRGWKQVVFQQGGLEFKVVKVTQNKHIWGLLKVQEDSPYCLVQVDEGGRILTRFDPLPGNRFDYYEGETGDPEGFFMVENAPDWHNRLFWEIKNNGERTAVFPPVDPSGIPTSILARLEDGRLWFNEMRLFERKAKLIFDLKSLYPGFGKPMEVSWLKDRQGGIWLGTAYGLILVDIQEDHFRRFLYQASDPVGDGIACRGMLEYKGKLFVNSERQFQGRYSINLKTGIASPLPGGGLIYGIAIDQDARLWTDRGGTPADDQEGLVQIDPGNGNALLTVSIPSKIWCIFQQNDQHYLLGCLDGIYQFNLQTKEIKKLDTSRFPEIATASVVHIARDRHGSVWACAETGLYEIDAAGKLAARYWPGGQGVYYLPVDNILHFYEDKEDVFWIGTRGDGLIKWDKNNNQKQILFRGNGILNGYIYGIYEDDFDHLWMPTDYGIVQFDKKKLQVRHTWLTTNGVAQNEFNRISHTRGEDGTFYFGGLNGVTAFHPKDFYHNGNKEQQPFQLVLSSFFLLGEAGKLENKTSEIAKSGKFQIHPGDRYVQIEFALLDFSNANTVSYSWKTEGVDADWTYLTKPELRLSNLPPGAHHLRIRAQAAGGQWAENEINIYLDVLPPFYLRTRFLLLVIILLTIGIWYWQQRNTWEKEKLQRTVEQATAKIQVDKKTIEQQAAELRKLDEAKSRFFVNISHELRTPLTLMLGPISSALTSNKLDKDNNYLIQLADAHGKNLLGMVNQILDLSKLDAGRLEIQNSPVLLSSELQRIAAMFESHALLKGIHFDYHYQTTDAQLVELDAPKLHTILNNLLANALKYTPSGGEVCLNVVEQDFRIEIQVKDSGRGIHPDDLPHVFNRFYQTAQPNVAMEGGTGIGLALSQELTLMMNGLLSVKSQLNEGSVFTLVLPKKIATDFSVPEKEPDETAILQTELPVGQLESTSLKYIRPTILVVEDNDNIRDYLQLLLSEKYTVETAANGQQALDLLTSGVQKHQLIISDIMMPVMDGYQLLENLKGDDRFRHIPVVMLTARAHTSDKLRALRIGVDDYLLKPFETDELLARLENLLANYARRAGLKGPEEPEKIPDFQVATDFSGSSGEDMEWLARLEELVMISMGQFDLNAETLATQMFTSRSQLFRRVKQISGLSLNEYIQEIRFQQARHLLEQKKYTTIKAVALSVGFKHTNHFALSYKKRFGKSPSAYY